MDVSLNASILEDCDRQLIGQTASLSKYRDFPVPREILETLSGDLASFVSVPYTSKSRLSALYGQGLDYMALLAADWEEAYARGVLRMHNERTISFPTHVAMANGEAVEVSISKNAQEGGLAWFLAYVPLVERMKLWRDRDCGVEGEIQEEKSPKDPLPEISELLFKKMGDSQDYLLSPVPQDVMASLANLGPEFSSFVWVSQRWANQIFEYAGSDIDALELLARDWAYAYSNRTLRYYDNKIVFPVSIVREDGETLVEISIKRNTHVEKPGAKPWVVCYADNFARAKANAGRALMDWAYIPSWSELLETLSAAALNEKWDFESNGAPRTNSILGSYFTYTFYRLYSEGKVLEDRDKGIAAFNTGLVDETYEAIYACFSPSNVGQPWRFESFCKAGSKTWGKKLVATFDPLPDRAQYFERKEDLLFDGSRTLQRDVDHILLDNIDRLPEAFLAEELRGAPDALEVLETIHGCENAAARNRAFDELREIVGDNVKIKRRLINRLDDAIELAQKRVEWNFKTAVPAFYPTKNTMSLLLPLDLTENDQPDVALVVELMESGAYIGQTILTMRMAYNNARLICRPDSDWLNTSLRIPEEGE